MSFLSRLGLKSVYFIESNHGELENVNSVNQVHPLQGGGDIPFTGIKNERISLLADESEHSRYNELSSSANEMPRLRLVAPTFNRNSTENEQGSASAQVAQKLYDVDLTPTTAVQVLSEAVVASEIRRKSDVAPLRSKHRGADVAPEIAQPGLEVVQSKAKQRPAVKMPSVSDFVVSRDPSPMRGPTMRTLAESWQPFDQLNLDHGFYCASGHLYMPKGYNISIRVKSSRSRVEVYYNSKMMAEIHLEDVEVHSQDMPFKRRESVLRLFEGNWRWYVSRMSVKVGPDTFVEYSTLKT